MTQTQTHARTHTAEELSAAALEFLSRAQLSGQEAPAFNHVLAWIEGAPSAYYAAANDAEAPAEARRELDVLPRQVG